MKKNTEKILWVSFKDHLAEMMRKPGFKKAYDDLELEYRLISAMIDQRNKKKITQRQLAEKIGTKQSAIARFESGRANPRLSFLKKLSRALDVKLTVTR
ncbi:helix-turn-helix transcriptional regulator [Candidatus Uhrbacteria bacterium]|nr:helix-turn-helix transcriptional regulator [Candidatus Uhrbacteria bacterium]